ncbi:MAG: hypothetical protein GKR89_36190 [Candidatus Latescibacteria bacterium]|nr:hypothetical protein [Candidatus Latescibacterota bacterium]
MPSPDFCKSPVIYYFREGRKGKKREEKATDQDARLTEIERRLTDTQDVMIALSEKLDRWEEQDKLAAGKSANKPLTTGER